MEQFILGFVAGEGSFQIDVSPREERRRFNVEVRPHFSILVHETKILKMIKEYFGYGKINEYDTETRWDIRSISECRQFANWIYSNSTKWFESTEKYKQFNRWEEALSLLEKGHTADRLKDVVSISYEIGMPDKRKRNIEYYHEIIERGREYHLCDSTDTVSGEPCQRHVATKTGTCQWH